MSCPCWKQGSHLRIGQFEIGILSQRHVTMRSRRLGMLAPTDLGICLTRRGHQIDRSINDDGW